MIKIKTKQNFISADGKTVRNSHGEFFTVNELVAHQDETVGNATIIRFSIDTKMNEIEAFTDKGYAHIDFLEKHIQ